MPAPRPRSHARRARRRQRQEGYVLFIVLMIVSLSTLGATFAVQDSTFGLQGARGAQVAMVTRYAAESGVNTLPALVVERGPETLQVELDTYKLDNTSTLTDGDGGTSMDYAFNRQRLHLPPPADNDVSFKLMNSRELERAVYLDGGVPQHSLVNDPRAPNQLMYESIIEGRRGAGDTYHYTISTYGRSTMGWDDETGGYTSGDVTQSGDDNPYHDTVSLARGYYTTF